MRTSSERSTAPGDLSGVVTVLGALYRRPWITQAACADSGLRWIPDTVRGMDNLSQVVPLLEICAVCPVRGDCLLDAFDTDGGVELYGVWGGTTMMERRAARTAIGPRNSDAWRLRDPHVVAEIVETFEATFPERLEGWRERLAEHQRWLGSRFTLGGRGDPGRGHLGAAGC